MRVDANLTTKPFVVRDRLSGIPLHNVQWADDDTNEYGQWEMQAGGPVVVTRRGDILIEEVGSAARIGLRFQSALVKAFDLHRYQTRKSTGVSSLGHLLGVASIVIDAGGTEDEAIAGLFHDAVEDQGGRDVLDEIRADYGINVARIVEGCTDAYETPKPDWRTRKERHIANLPEESKSVHTVYAADKVHNLRTLLESVRRDGPEAFTHFKGGEEGTLWYFDAVLNTLTKAPRPLILEARGLLFAIKLELLR